MLLFSWFTFKGKMFCSFIVLGKKIGVNSSSLWSWRHSVWYLARRAGLMALFEESLGSHHQCLPCLIVGSSQSYTCQSFGKEEGLTTGPCFSILMIFIAHVWVTQFHCCDSTSDNTAFFFLFKKSRAKPTAFHIYRA